MTRYLPHIDACTVQKAALVIGASGYFGGFLAAVEYALTRLS